MAATIGIKIANGGFYSIIEENSAVKKRLILTTVHDNQRSVQIDLYKTFTKTMADALYIGSLVVEKIKPKPKGEPSIEMIITSTPEGEITADAIDLDTISGGEHHYLNVSLKSLDEDNRESEIPDFELEQHEGPPSGLYTGSARARKKEGAFPWLPVILVGLIIIIALLAVWFFALRGSPLSLSETGGSTAQSRPAAPPEPAPAPSPPPAQPAEPPAQTAAPVQPAAPPPVIKAPEAPPARTPAAGRNRPPAPVSSYQTPATIPRDGAPYRIRWGDTLWDISEAFYRNPWLYPRIARFNNIKNPDLIVSGTTIRIPPKN